MTDEVMSPLRWRMIEDMTIRRITTVIGQTTPHRQHDLHEPSTITNAVTVLTSNSKPSGLWQVETCCVSSQWSANPMRFKDHRELHARVVERAISATPKPLKLHVARNIKSPFSNTRAIASKLCRVQA
jgi:hypothetical protein